MGAILGSIIGGGVLGVGNLLGSLFSDKNAVNELEDAEAEVKRKRDATLKMLDLQFDVAKKQANKSALRSDEASDINERAIANDANGQIRGLSLQQISDTMGWNSQAMSADQSRGDALSSIASSGTRSSSMQQAVEQQASLNSAQLQQQQDATRAGQSLSLAQVFNNLSQNKANIQADRTDAFDLRQSYKSAITDSLGRNLGRGDQYALYAENRNDVANQYNAQIKKIEKEMDKHTGFNSFLNGVKAFFGGAVQGAGQGAAMGQFVADVKPTSFSRSVTARGVTERSVKRLDSVKFDNLTNAGYNAAVSSDYYRYGTHWK